MTLVLDDSEIWLCVSTRRKVTCRLYCDTILIYLSIISETNYIYLPIKFPHSFLFLTCQGLPIQTFQIFPEMLSLRKKSLCIRVDLKVVHPRKLDIRQK